MLETEAASNLCRIDCMYTHIYIYIYYDVHRHAYTYVHTCTFNMLKINFRENTVYIDGSGGMHPQENKFLGYIKLYLRPF